jgi:hypothetical protein
VDISGWQHQRILLWWSAFRTVDPQANVIQQERVRPTSTGGCAIRALRTSQAVESARTSNV